MTTARLVGSTLVLMSLVACGGGGGTSGPTSATTGPSQATITVAQAATGQVCISPLPNVIYRLRVPVRITESAGLGASVNFARLRLIRGGVEIERREITANDIIASQGTNRLAPNGTLTPTLSIDFNSDPFSLDPSPLSFGFTDDRGNNLTAEIFVTVIVQPICTI